MRMTDRLEDEARADESLIAIRIGSGLICALSTWGFADTLADRWPEMSLGGWLMVVAMAGPMLVFGHLAVRGRKANLAWLFWGIRIFYLFALGALVWLALSLALPPRLVVPVVGFLVAWAVIVEWARPHVSAALGAVRLSHLMGPLVLALYPLGWAWITADTMTSMAYHEAFLVCAATRLFVPLLRPAARWTLRVGDSPSAVSHLPAH